MLPMIETRRISSGQAAGPSWPLLAASFIALAGPAAYWFFSVSYLFFLPVAFGVTGLALAFDTRWPMSKQVIASFIIAVASVAAPHLALAGLELWRPRVHFVVPDGYQGAFAVIIDSESGGGSAERYGWSDKYTVGSFGTVRVANDVFNNVWLVVKASYANGAPIPMDRLWPLGTHTTATERSYWWYIGDEHEARTAIDSVHRQTGRVGNRSNSKSGES